MAINTTGVLQAGFIMPFYHLSNSIKAQKGTQITDQNQKNHALGDFRRTVASSPYSECTSWHQQGHASSKTLLKENHSVLN